MNLQVIYVVYVDILWKIYSIHMFIYCRGADISNPDDNYNSPVLTAARFASAEIVEILLRRDPQQYEIRYDTDLDDKNPLHVAAERDDGDIIKVNLIKSDIACMIIVDCCR